MGYRGADNTGLQWGNPFADQTDSDFQAALERESQLYREEPEQPQGPNSLVGYAAKLVPGSDNWVESSVKNLGARAGEILSGPVQLAANFAEATLGADGTALVEEVPVAIGFGIPLLDQLGNAPIKDQVDFLFGNREDIAKEYPDYTWEAFKETWSDPESGLGTKAREIAELVVTQGPSTVVDGYLAAKNALLYITARTGELTEDRKQSTGESTQFGDIMLSAATAAVVQQMEKLGFDTAVMNNAGVQKLVNAITGKVASRLPHMLVSGATEGTTEYVQEFIEGMTTDVKDDLSNLAPAAEANAIDALAGLIVGAGVGATLGMTGPAQKRNDVPEDEAQAANFDESPEPELPLGLPEAPAPKPYDQTQEQAIPETPPEVEEQLELLLGQPEQEVTPGNQETPTAAPATPSTEGQEPDTGSPMEFPVGVLDNGQQDYLAPAEEPLELPEGVDPNSLVQTIESADTRFDADRKAGQKLRKTGFGKLLEQAVRGKASAAQLEKLIGENPEWAKLVGDATVNAEENEKRGKVEQVHNYEKYRRQKAGIEAARKATPGPALAQFTENMAKIAERRRIDLADALKNGAFKNQREKFQLQELERALATQVDQFQGLTEQVVKAVRTEPGTGSVTALAGTLARNAPAFKHLGYDIEPMLRAESLAEARKAMDAVAKKAAAKASAIGDLPMPPRRSLPEELRGQITQKDRDIRSVRAEDQRRGQASGKSTVPTMTPEALYADEYMNEAGRPVVEVRAPAGSPEREERSAEIRKRNAAEERRKYGTVTDWSSRGTNPYENEYDEGDNLRRKSQKVLTRTPVNVGGGDKFEGHVNRLYDKIATLEEEKKTADAERRKEIRREMDRLEADIFELERRGFGVTNIEMPKEVAEKSGRTRPPSSSEKQLRESIRKLRKVEIEERDKGQEFHEELELMAQAERKVRLKEAKKAAASADSVEKIEPAKPKAPSSKPLPERDRGRPRSWRETAKKAFRNYVNAYNKGAVKGPSPDALKSAAKITAQSKLSDRGTPALLVYNPKYKDAGDTIDDALVLVKGAYPKRQPIVKGKKVKRATPHKPGDPAPYAFLKKRTFFFPEDVEMIPGNHTEADLHPEAVDSFIDMLNKTDFGFDPKSPSYGRNVVAMADYLMSLEGRDRRARGRSKAKSVIEGIENRPADTRDPGEGAEDIPEVVEITPEDTEERSAVESLEEILDDASDMDTEVDEDALVQMFLDYYGDPTEADPDSVEQEYESLSKKVSELEEGIAAAKEMLPAIEEKVRGTPSIDSSLTYETGADWPLTRALVHVFEKGGKIVDEYGTLEYPVKDGVSMDEAMVQAIMRQVESIIAASEVQLDGLRKRLEKINERRGQKTTRRGQAPARGVEDGDGDLSAGGDERTASTGGRSRNVDDPVPGVERIDPGSRSAVDLYEQARKPDAIPAAAVQRVGALAVPGPDGRPVLNEHQVFGAAAAYHNWKRAVEKGTGAFLNIDGTGFGKSRQIAAASKLIAEDEAASGRNRPIGIFFPGGNAEWKKRNGEWVLTNPLGNNIVSDMRAIGVDPRAEYADGTPMFVFRPYNSLRGEKGKTEYAAVFADEAHEVKGVGVQAQGFDALNTPYRAFFTATPTDMAGQELYWLKHMVRKPGEGVEEAAERLATSLNLTLQPDGKYALTRGGKRQVSSDTYLDRLDRIMTPFVRMGAVLSRTYGRASKNYTITADVVDEEAKALYDKLLDSGVNPNDDVMVRLNEHMKVPYLLERTKKRVEENHNKVIAVFTSTGKSKSVLLRDTPFAEPAIDRYMRGVQRMEIPAHKLAGDAKSIDDQFTQMFQGDDKSDGFVKVLAVSDSRASTGLNLNDKFGDSPRYMLIAATTMRGERLMQLLGRHDRQNNRSVPYTEYVRLDNPTDKAFRLLLEQKTRLQRRISGVDVAKTFAPEKFTPELYEQEGWLERRAKQPLQDSTDALVSAAAARGTKKVKELVHEIATSADSSDLRSLAADLLRVSWGWDTVRLMPLRRGQQVLARYMPVYDGTGIIEMGDASQSQSLLHELVHHFTHKRIEADASAKQDLETLMIAMLDSDSSLAREFPNAFLDAHEFVAEAFSDPDFQARLRQVYVGSDKKSLNMFQRFMRWVKQLLGVTDESMTVLEHIVDLDLMAAEQGQDAWSMQTHELRMPAVPRNRPRERATALEKWQKRVSLSARAEGAWDKVRKAMIWSMTYDQIVDTYRDLGQRTLAMGRPGNVLEDMVATQEAISAQANRNTQRYEKRVMEPLEKFAKGRGKEMIKVQMSEGGPVEEMTQLEYLAQLMNISGYAGIHFGKPESDRANRMMHPDKDGKVPRPHAVAAWKLHRKNVRNPKMFEAMKVYTQIADFFESERTRKSQIVAGAYLDTLFPDAKVSWTQRPMKEIRAKLKALGEESDEVLKQLGATRQAMDDIQTMMKPGIVPGAYFPLKRYGQYVVVIDGDFTYSDDKERDRLLRKYPMAKDDDGLVKIKSVNMFESHVDAQRFYEEMREKFPKGGNIDVKQVELKYASEQEIFGATSFSALADNFSKQVDKKVEDRDTRDTVKQLFAQAMLDMMPETSVANSMRPRAGTHGASLDIIRTMYNYGSSQGYLLANLQFSREQRKLAQELRGLTAEKTGRDQRALETVRQALMSRNRVAAKGTVDLGALGQTLSDVGFLYYLVGFSYNLVNATQTALVTVPYLSARYGPAKTTSAMIRAYKLVGGAPVKEIVRTGGTLTELRGLFSGDDFNRENYDILNGPDGILSALNDPNHVKMLRILEGEGHIEASMSMDMTRHSKRPHVDAKGNQIPPTSWDYLTDWMRTFPHITEVMNRSVTAVAAFDLEYEKSKNFDKAVAEARRAVKQTHFVYQFWNKPPAFQNPIGRTALMFKQHVQHMYYYMIRNAVVSFKGKSAEERAIGRKALLYFVAMHMGMAGVAGGTPELVKWLLNLAFWAFGDDDDPLNFDRLVRNTMYDLMGKPGATLASQGLPGFIGLDLSGRIGIDSMLLFEAPNTTDKDAFLASTMRIAGGPMVSLAERGIAAKQAYARGDYYRMVEATLPKMLRDGVKSIRYADEGYRDLAGNVYRDAEDISWWEYGYTALGFASKPESDTYQSRGVGFDRYRIDRKRRQLFTRYYTAETKAQRQRVIEDIRKWNQDNPHFAVTRSDLVRSVQQRKRRELLTEKGTYVPESYRGWAREQQRSY